MVIINLQLSSPTLHLSLFMVIINLQLSSPTLHLSLWIVYLPPSRENNLRQRLGTVWKIRRRVDTAVRWGGKGWGRKRRYCGAGGIGRKRRKCLEIEELEEMALGSPTEEETMAGRGVAAEIETMAGEELGLEKRRDCGLLCTSPQAPCWSRLSFSTSVAANLLPEGKMSTSSERKLFFFKLGKYLFEGIHNEDLRDKFIVFLHLFLCSCESPLFQASLIPYWWAV